MVRSHGSLWIDLTYRRPASLDEHAFRRRIPEVGPAPDFINDDLPSNLDYLDDSFSATAGLRELPSDDELDGFGSDDHSSEILVQNDQPGVIFKYGGETIRLLNPEGLHLIDNYFETLPPDAADESAQCAPNLQELLHFIHLLSSDMVIPLSRSERTTATLLSSCTMGTTGSVHVELSQKHPRR